MAATETAIVEKVCSRCGETKSLSEYYFHSRINPKLKSRYEAECKKCMNKKSREYGAKHREHLNKQSKVYHDKPENKERMRGYCLERNYGVTLVEYNELFNNQNGLCAICGKHQSELTRALAVDHCHETGKVRGLLCHSCNIGIGLLGDSVENLEIALVYLSERKV